MATLVTIQASDIVADSRTTINNNFAALNDQLATAYLQAGTPVALSDGGTGVSLSDPNADRILFWDDSAGQMTWLSVGTGLSIAGTTLVATGLASPLTTKGDLYAFSTVNARLPVGTNGQILTADSTQTLGIKWATGGTVSSVSVTTANGISGTVNTATTTPAILLSLGAITPTSVNGVSIYSSTTAVLQVTGTASISGSNTGDQNTFATISVSGNLFIIASSPTDTLTLIEGQNVTLETDPSAKSVTISAIQHKSIAIEGVTGTVNGVNDTFTIIHTPTWMTVDGVTLVEGFGFTLTGKTIVFDDPPGSGVNIHNFYDRFPDAADTAGQMIGFFPAITYA